MAKLKDLRDIPTTVEECDELKSQLATTEIELALLQTKAEKEIDRIKTDLDAETGELRSLRATITSRITGFIEANQDKFQKPRKRKTQYGTYGLQHAAEVDVFDKKACTEHCANHGLMDCVRINANPIKAGIKKRIDAGETIPGVRVQEGDLAVATIAKAIIDQALGG